MKIRAPQDGIITTWEPQKTLKNRPVEIGTELLQVAAVEGEWEMEVDVPDDDMGPILDAQSRLQKEIAAGTKPAGTALEAYFVTATDPEHRYPGFVRRIAAKAETVETKHVVKLTVGFTDKVRDDFLAAEPDAPARLRGPRPGPVRRGPAGLRPAPRRGPRLLRDRPLPLAVHEVSGMITAGSRVASAAQAPRLRSTPIGPSYHCRSGRTPDQLPGQPDHQAGASRHAP